MASKEPMASLDSSKLFFKIMNWWHLHDAVTPWPALQFGALELELQAACEQLH